MASTIGTAYINIAPNMSGIQGKIASGLQGTGSDFANQFSSEISTKSAVIMGAIAGVVGSATSSAMNLVTQQFSAAVSRFDTIQNFPKVMQNFGISTTDAASAMAVLTAGVHSLPTSLNDIVSLTEAFTPLSANVGQASKLALALNDAMLAGGAPMDVQSAAMEQFRQALAKGMPQLQDWRSIETAMPAQLQQISEKLGLGSGALKDYSTNGQGLYNAMQDGKISMTDFNNALLALNQNGINGLPNFQQQAANASNGIATSFTVLKQSIQQVMVDIMTSIGQQNISNAIKSIGTAIQTAYTDVKAMIDYMVKNKDVFGPIAVAIGGIVVALTGLMIANKVETAITAVQKAMVGAQVAMATYTALTEGGTGAMEAFDMAFDANPISIIVVAITALVAGLIYFFTQTKLGKQIFADFVSFLGTAWDAIKTGFEAVATFFTGVWNGITTGLAAVGNFFKGIFDAISGAVSAFLTFFDAHWRLIIAIVLGPLGLLIDFVTAYWSQITGAISTALNAIWGVITGIFNAIVGFVSAVWQTEFNIISTVVNAIWGVISTVFGAIAGFMAGVFGPPINAIVSAFQWLAGIVGGIVSGIWTGVSNAFNSVLTFLGGIGSKIMGLFGDAGTWLVDTGKNIIQGLINGAGSLLSKIGDMFLKLIPSWIVGPFKKALGINSPSRVFAGFGGNITTGLVQGITKQASDVTDAVGTLSDNAVAGMNNTNGVIAAQFAPATAPSPSASSQVANNGNAVATAPGQAGITQNNNIYNQVDLNSVTRELAWQIRR